jgi:hypothetical protein
LVALKFEELKSPKPPQSPSTRTSTVLLFRESLVLVGLESDVNERIKYFFLRGTRLKRAVSNLHAHVQSELYFTNDKPSWGAWHSAAVPEANLHVSPSRREAPNARCEGDRRDEVPVGFVEGAQAAALAHVPHFDGSVVGARQQVPEKDQGNRQPPKHSA